MCHINHRGDDNSRSSDDGRGDDKGGGGNECGDGSGGGSNDSGGGGRGDNGEAVLTAEVIQVVVPLIGDVWIVQVMETAVECVCCMKKDCH